MHGCCHADVVLLQTQLPPHCAMKSAVQVDAGICIGLELRESHSSDSKLRSRMIMCKVESTMIAIHFMFYHVHRYATVDKVAGLNRLSLTCVLPAGQTCWACRSRACCTGRPGPRLQPPSATEGTPRPP